MNKRNESGFTLLEVMTAVAVMGILVAMATPSVLSMLERQQTKSSATQMAGLLSDARARAVAEGTPHLVYFNAPSVDGSGNCAAAAVEVRDLDHSYSITAGDQTKEFHLEGGCDKVKPLDPSTVAAGDSAAAAAMAAVPMPREDLAVKAADAASVGAVAVRASTAVVGSAVASATGTVGSTASTVATTVGSVAGSSGSNSSGGSSGSNSSGGGSGSSSSGGSTSSSSEDGSGSGDSNGQALAIGQMAVDPPRSTTVAETVVNGATFPVDAVSGRPVIAFSELGIPVDPANPNSWGSGAGGMYLTDSTGSTIVAALVEPLGDIKLRTYDPTTQSWK